MELRINDAALLKDNFEKFGGGEENWGKENADVTG